MASFALHAAALYGVSLLPRGGAFGAGTASPVDDRYLTVSFEFLESSGVAARPDPDPAPQPGAAAQSPYLAANHPGMLPVAGSYYFQARELDSRLMVLEPSVKLVYPEGVAENLDGRVVLRLLVSERGAIDDVVVMESDPAGMFEQSATAAFRNAQFSPGMKGGKPVKSQMVVEVRYHGEPQPSGMPAGAAAGAIPANSESH